MSAHQKVSPADIGSSVLDHLDGGHWLDVLPAAAYVCGADGTIRYYNKPAADLGGLEPYPGALPVSFTGAILLVAPAGAPSSDQDNPVAEALAIGRDLRDQALILERADGSHVEVLANISPVRNAAGTVEGAICVLHATSAPCLPSTLAAQHLASIVESSSDAILAKNLDGIITSWNQGASQLFGYRSEEVIGQPITMLFPPEKLLEEQLLIEKIRRGDRIDHYETIRRHKDGSLIEISLTVSPIRNQFGTIVGASKIARDITGRRRSEEQKDLLLREMNHRVKNLFALSSGLVRLSARSARTVEKLVADLQARFAALARAHTMTLPTSVLFTKSSDAGATTLHALIRTMAQPYISDETAPESRVIISGPDLEITTKRLTSFALIVHEFVTNAAKYGALASADGTITIRCQQHDGRFDIAWEEYRAAPLPAGAIQEGFGSQLARITIKGSLNGEFSRDFSDHGLTIRLTFPAA